MKRLFMIALALMASDKSSPDADKDGKTKLSA